MKPKMADPRMSEGAGLERLAFRSYLRRKCKVRSWLGITEALEWIDARHKRYDKKKGGLGK